MNIKSLLFLLFIHNPAYQTIGKFERVCSALKTQSKLKFIEISKHSSQLCTTTFWIIVYQ